MRYAPLTAFSAISGLHPLLWANLQRARFSAPTPIQRHAIPLAQLGRDLLAVSQAGSGKTLAYVLPVLARLLHEGPPPTPDQSGVPPRLQRVYPTVLVLVSTRELATQVGREWGRFAAGSPLRTVVLFGGVAGRQQFEELEQGCDVLVATPGRLQDLVARSKLALANVHHFIVDEADRMMDLGFDADIRHILRKSDIPRTGRGRQTMMFSATFTKPIQELAAEFLWKHIFISVGKMGCTMENIKQKVLWVEEDQKREFLLGMLLHLDAGLTLVFVNSKEEAKQLARYLFYAGLPVAGLHGGRTQEEREVALSKFRKGVTPILVATDIAARGLDVPNVQYVIQYDLCNSIDDYVHRVGRTGRAGRTGVAINFVSERRHRIAAELVELLKDNRQEIPVWLYGIARHLGERTLEGNQANVGEQDFRQDDPDGRAKRRGKFDSFSAEAYRGFSTAPAAAPPPPLATPAGHSASQHYGAPGPYG
eukprot:EG_transcript_8744